MGNKCQICFLIVYNISGAVQMYLSEKRHKSLYFQLSYVSKQRKELFAIWKCIGVDVNADDCLSSCPSPRYKFSPYEGTILVGYRSTHATK